MLLQIQLFHTSILLPAERLSQTLRFQGVGLLLLILNYNSKKQKDMLLGSNLLMAPPQQVEVSREVQEELKECRDNCKAVYFYIRSTLRKIFDVFKHPPEDSLPLRFYYNKFTEAILESKVGRIQEKRMVTALQTMRKSWISSQRKHLQRQSLLKIAQKSKTAALFNEWRHLTKLEKSSRQLGRLRLSDLFREALALFKENQERGVLKKLMLNSQNISSQSIHGSALRRKAFEGFVMNTKMAKIQNMLKIDRFKEMIKRIISHNKSSAKYDQYRTNKLLSCCFMQMKQTYHEAIADRHLRIRKQSICFNHWRNSLDYLISEKELEKSNECIINIFRERKTKNLLFGLFSKWAEQVRESKELKRQNSILNKYADLKYKQSLLKRHFHMLKQNCINNKIKNDYYGLKLKRKAINSFKLLIYQSLEKEESIIKFIEKVERRKYFDRIKRFNEEEKLKVKMFRLSKMFTAFAFSIVYEYYTNQNRAVAYHSRNLMYKALYVLKQKASFSKREEYCITYLNAICPLKRWVKRHRLQRFRLQNDWFSKKRIFREWRLLVIRKDSEKKLTRQFKIEDSIKPAILEDSKQEQFQFDNIMATIAKIRRNFMAEKQETLNNESMRWPAVQTPSQQINFSYSLENIEQ